jgi:hypothetical protein
MRGVLVAAKAVVDEAENRRLAGVYLAGDDREIALASVEVDLVAVGGPAQAQCPQPDHVSATPRSSRSTRNDCASSILAVLSRSCRGPRRFSAFVIKRALSRYAWA